MAMEVIGVTSFDLKISFFYYFGFINMASGLWQKFMLPMKMPKMMLRMLMLISNFQIVSFLGKERMVEFLSLKSNEERISFMYRHEAYRPLLQVLWQILQSSLCFVHKI